VASVEVRQSFKNPTGDSLEATYLFPLPHQASVFGMQFRIGERTVKGLIKEKEEARRAYQAARAQGRAATLLEQDRPNLFTLSVANIAPHATIEVLLQYQELVTFDDGEWRFVFPMVAGERYNPPEMVTDPTRVKPPSPRRKKRASPITVDVQLFGAQKPDSPSHALKIDDIAGGYRVSLAEETVPNRDFVLRWGQHGQGLHPSIWFQREKGKPGTFCVCLPAPRKAAAVQAQAPVSGKGMGCGNCGAPFEGEHAVSEIPLLGPAWRCDYCGVFHRVEPAVAKSGPTGKDVVFLVDGSASMKTLGVAPKLVKQTLALLEPQDAFAIISFHHDLIRLSEDWLPCDGPSIKRAEEFLGGLRSRGGTELELALKAAGEAPRPDRTRVVVLLTDAAVGNEGRLLRHLPQWLGDARLYVLGLGPACNRYLIDKLALHGKGAFDVAVADEPEVLRRFAERVKEAGPILRGLSVSLDGATSMEVYPRGDLALFSGQSVLLAGRYVGSGPARLQITGFTAQGADFRQELLVEVPESAAEADGLERIWARMRIEDLQDQLTHRPETLSDVRLEVLGLALKHQLMSPYTALVAEDSEVSVDPKAPLRQMEVERAEVVAAPLDFAEERETGSLAEPAGAPMRCAAPSAVESGWLGSDAVTFEAEMDYFGSPPGAVAGSTASGDLFSDERSGGAALFDAADDGAECWADEEMADDLFLDDDEGCAFELEDAPPEPPRHSLASRVVSFFSKSSPSAPPSAAPSAAPSAPSPAAAPSPPPPPPPPGFSVAEALKSVWIEPSPSPPSTPGGWGSEPFARRAPEPTARRRSWEAEDEEDGWGPTPPQGQAPPVQAIGLKPTYSEEELARARELMKGRLDLVFLVDETGSMGPYIEQVQRHLLALVQALRKSPLCQALRLGLVTFRDHPPQDSSFVTRVVPLTDKIDDVVKGVRRMIASGGGDGPEAVTDGLNELLSLDWDHDAARLVVMVGDAPPHGVEPGGDGFPDGCPCGRHWHTQAESCREMGITVHCVGCAGITNFLGAEQVFQLVARTTGGLYLPLNRAELLIGLVSSLADRELDRQRIERLVEEVYTAHQAALEQADPPEQVRFITETLLAQDVRTLDLACGTLGRSGKLAFRKVRATDVEMALESVLRRQPIPH
jgi:Ca-activated chloride channel family protein